MPSIQRFLFLSVLAVVIVATIISTVWSYHDARHEVEELFDAQLAQLSRVLKNLVESDLAPLEEGWITGKIIEQLAVYDDEGHEALPYGHTYEKKIAYQILDDSGQVLAHSASAPATPLSDRRPGFSRKEVDSYLWHTFSLHSTSTGLWFIVSEREDVRGEYTREILYRSLIPVLVILPLISLLIWVIIQRGFRPLGQIEQELAERQSSNLQPIGMAAVPKEIRSLVDTINNLLDRLQKGFQREKRFTANAAHELRTPLAALQVHIENAQQTPSDPGHGATLAKADHGVKRMAHLVEQLLTISRLEPDAINLHFQRIDMANLAREVLADLAPRAIRKHIDLSLQPENGECEVSADTVTMEILLRNLIDNAIRYTPDHGRIAVSLRREPGALRLEIADNGPGIPGAMRDSVFDRFYRIREYDNEGSGLGLSIVRQILKLYDADIRLAQGLDGRGLSVFVTLPDR